jgi:hypothetical protein
MRNFDITDLRDGSGLALVLYDPIVQKRSVAVYHESELYPLRSERYHRQLPNLFVDILDTIDGYGPQGVDADHPDQSYRKEVSAALSAPQVSLRTLVRRAQRAVQDGSGAVGHRYHDALDLWEHVSSHALAAVSAPTDPPITDVRKSHNWRKQQPNAQKRADPAAWYVVSVYSRSNAQKDAITAYRGLTAVLESLSAQDTDDADSDALRPADRPDARSLWRAVTGNLDFPTYQQVSKVLGDSNMLVFHSDASLAQWIRAHDSDTGVRTGKSEMGTSTPVKVVFRTARGIRIVPGDTHQPVAGFDGLESGQQISVANLANRLSPRN